MIEDHLGSLALVRVRSKLAWLCNIVIYYSSLLPSLVMLRYFLLFLQDMSALARASNTSRIEEAGKGAGDIQARQLTRWSDASSPSKTLCERFKVRFGL